MFSYWSTSATLPSLRLPQTFLRKQTPLPQNFTVFKKSITSSIVCLTFSLEQFTEIAQNKVLISAVVSSAIGQLSKPFTSALIYGNNIDLRTLVRAGGFPSVHSASVIAAATSLGLERGFSDSIFGTAAIFAALVMYDAQAVRREVGRHAKVLNKKILVKTQKNSIPCMNMESLVDSKPVTSSKNSESLLPLLSVSEKATPKSSAMNSAPHYTSELLSSGSNSKPSAVAVDDEPVSNININCFSPLEESIGHTEVEVIAGGLLGFLVTLAVYSLM